MRVTNVCQHSFVPELLRPGGVVLDCGVAYGDFSRWISQNTRCHVHGLEPDPGFFGSLPALERCRFHPVALTAAPGRAVLHAGSGFCSSLHFAGETKTVEVEATSLEVFCRSQGIETVELWKLDIEGAELDVLETVDLDFLNATVRQITIEFHDHLDAAAVPRIRRALARLSGFASFRFTRHTYGDVLLLNRRYVTVSWSDHLVMAGTKYWRGTRRLLARRVRQAPTALPA